VHPTAKRRYAARLSGPLLDRIDLQVDLPPVSRAELAGEHRGEPTPWWPSGWPLPATGCATGWAAPGPMAPGGRER